MWMKDKTELDKLDQTWNRLSLEYDHEALSRHGRLQMKDPEMEAAFKESY